MKMVAMRIDRFEYNFYFNSCEGDYILKQHDLETNCIEVVSFGIEKTIKYIKGLINDIDTLVNNTNNENIKLFLLEVKQDYNSLIRQIGKLNSK